MMELRFIFHSSFLVTLSECYLLFDYYQGDIPELDPEKPLLVFASHQHYDHFSPVIFHLLLKYPKCEFILSDDISQETVDAALRELGQTARIHWVREGDVLRIGDVHVDALPSTDVGVSYLVQTVEKLFFHAGDLNAWLWPNVPRSKNEEMRKAFLAALDTLYRKLDGKALDAAFFPLDPVMGDACYEGPVAFLERIPVKHFLPMHMWEQYSVEERFLTAYPKYKEIFCRIHGAGEQII